MTRRREKPTTPSSKPSGVPDLPMRSPSAEEEAQVSGGLASRYIAETEKNLGRTLASAEPSSANLLFTEGDDLLK